MPEFTFKDIVLLRDVLAWASARVYITGWMSLDGHLIEEIDAVWTKVTDWADAVRPSAPEE